MISLSQIKSGSGWGSHFFIKLSNLCFGIAPSLKFPPSSTFADVEGNRIASIDEHITKLAAIGTNLQILNRQSGRLGVFEGIKLCCHSFYSRPRSLLRGSGLGIQFPYRIANVSIDFGRRIREVTRSLGILASSTCLFLGRIYQSFSISSALNQYTQSQYCDNGQNDSENSHPSRSRSGNPSRLIGGAFFFLLGATLMHLAFYIADEPNPPVGTRCIYWVIGIFAVLSICHGLFLGLGFIVTQKGLTNIYYCNTVSGMANVLNTDKQITVIGALAEGSSIRSIERITGVHRDTIMRLGVKIGQGCTTLLDQKMRNLPCRLLQFDEVWGFIGKKERHVRADDDPQYGDVWTFCAIDADTKLVPSFKCGKRDLVTAKAFVADVQSRMANRVQISADALRAYVDAIEQTFGTDVDFGQIVKTYEHDDSQNAERKYSAAKFVSVEKRSVTGLPDMDLVSTSYIERLNATTRLHMRRLTRLTLAFSKKLENFEAAVGLHFAYYNLVKRHNSLRCTPAMAAGVERNFWSVGDLVEAAA